MLMPMPKLPNVEAFAEAVRHLEQLVSMFRGLPGTPGVRAKELIERIQSDHLVLLTNIQPHLFFDNEEAYRTRLPAAIHQIEAHGASPEEALEEADISFNANLMEHLPCGGIGQLLVDLPLLVRLSCTLVNLLNMIGWDAFEGQGGASDKKPLSLGTSILNEAAVLQEEDVGPEVRKLSVQANSLFTLHTAVHICAGDLCPVEWFPRNPPALAGLFEPIAISQWGLFSQAAAGLFPGGAASNSGISLLSF